MKQNFSQRLEIQIPQENDYIGLTNMHENELELTNFLIELPRAVELEDSYFTGCRD